jgi:DNA-binding MarR family transcriptional regulator
MGPVNNTTYLLQHIAEVLSKQCDQLLEEQLGIRLSQYKILMVLEWNPRIEQRVIANSLGQTEAAISRQIKLMIKKGLLTSKIDTANKKRHISMPTPLGMQITEAAESLIKNNFQKDYQAIGDNNIVELNRDLQELHKSICKAGKHGACNHLLGNI